MSQRKVLNLMEKMAIIREHDNHNLSVREIAKRFNIGKTQAATIIKEKPKIQLLFQSDDYNLNTKRSYLNEKGKQLDQMCLDWFSEIRSQNIAINGPAIQAKAKEIATDLGMTRFVASNGWLHKWRNRHNITYESTSGEAGSVNQGDDEQLYENFEFVAKDIFEVEDTKPSLRILSNDSPEISNQNQMLRVSLVRKNPPIAKRKRRTLRSRKVLNLKEKIEIINEHDKSNLSVREIAKRFNIGKTQAATIIKEKPKISSMWLSGDHNSNARRHKKSLKLDQICFDWFSEARSQNIPISGPEIQAKAKEIAPNIGMTGFLASNGWLQKWCNRHSIKLKSISQETAVKCQDSPSCEEYIIPTDLIKTSDSDNEHNSEAEVTDDDSWTISSNETALMAISKLKIFFENDYEAFKHLDNLEDHLLTRIFDDKSSQSNNPYSLNV